MLANGLKQKKRERDVVVVNLCAACAPKIIELIYQQLDKWQMSCVKITSVCHCVIFTFYTLSVSLFNNNTVKAVPDIL